MTYIVIFFVANKYGKLEVGAHILPLQGENNIYSTVKDDDQNI
jgi:hypothetical protein